MKLPLSTPAFALLVLLSNNVKFTLGNDGDGNGNGALYESIEPPCESTVAYDYDSGDITSTTGTIVSYKDAPWIQLDLTGTYLAPSTKLYLVGESTSEVISNNDALDVNGYSAYFIGQNVRVELRYEKGTGSSSRRQLLRAAATTTTSEQRDLAGPNETSRLVISNIHVGVCKETNPPASICGLTDDRIPSTDVRSGRLSMGCTGWMLSKNVYCTAGHCGTPNSNTRMLFTYDAIGVAVPAEDQFGMDVATYRGVDGGVGNDWGCGRLLRNSVTNSWPGEHQESKCLATGGSPGCAKYTMGTVPGSTSGQTIRITGYGTASVDSQSQKTHTGDLVSIGSGSLNYVPDTTGGNSGSPVIHENTGTVIGVHTHGGCGESNGQTVGSNTGSRADVAAFEQHRNWLLIECTTDDDCSNGNPSDGAEWCDANGDCQFGSPPTQAPTPFVNPCVEGETDLITIKVLTDGYPSETSWKLMDACNGNVVVREATQGSYGSTATWYTDESCQPDGRYTFEINDSYGDGICCGYGEGSFEVKWEGATVGSGSNFGSQYTTSFGECPPEVSPEPSRAPTPPPTPAPITPQPTPAPVTPQPTDAPVTPSPTKAPTDQPSDSPVTPSPTNAPVTDSPTKAPTQPPTNTPTSCGAGIGDPCQDGPDCCSGVCSGGKPSTRTCLAGSGPTTPPAPTPQNSPEPTRDCLGRNGQCGTDDSLCCSGTCKSNGKCGA